MKEIVSDKEYFNIKDTLECGQVFRFKKHADGYLVFSRDKCAYLFERGDKSVISCNDFDAEYFYNYFDLKRDYGDISKRSLTFFDGYLADGVKKGRGIRILNQDREEALFSFIVSQNNNIPRIKGIIERLCEKFGEKKPFDGETYYSFPTADKMAGKDTAEFVGAGLGYRAEYIKRLAEDITCGFNINYPDDLPSEDLRNNLVKIYGVGPKVADCVCLFGYHRTDRFPVDTWIEKVYKEDFGGKMTDRKKISAYFTEKFGEISGYIQQYLFYYKRSLEKTE